MEPEFWDEHETGNEHLRCSECGNIGPIPKTSEERQRRVAEHLAAEHNDGLMAPCGHHDTDPLDPAASPGELSHPTQDRAAPSDHAYWQKITREADERNASDA